MREGLEWSCARCFAAVEACQAFARTVRGGCCETFERWGGPLSGGGCFAKCTRRCLSKGGSRGCRGWDGPMAMGLFACLHLTAPASPRLNSPFPPPPAQLTPIQPWSCPPSAPRQSASSPPARSTPVRRCSPLSPPLLLRSLPTAAHLDPGRTLSPAVHRLTRLAPTHSTATRCRSERCGQACVSPLLLQAAMRADPDLTSPASQLAHRPHTACESMQSVTCSLCDLPLTKRTSSNRNLQTSRAPSTTRRRSPRPTRRTASTTGRSSASSACRSSRSSAQRPSRASTRSSTASSALPSSPTRTWCVLARLPSPIGPSSARLGSSGSQQSSRRGADPPLDHPRARRALTTS